MNGFKIATWTCHFMSSYWVVDEIGMLAWVPLALAHAKRARVS